MSDTTEIKRKILLMADKVYNGLNLIEKGFMENRLDHLADAMKEENIINEMQKILTRKIVELSKTEKESSGKAQLAALEQVIATLERIGDETANLAERIEIKVVEKLLFSDLGVQQFIETFDATKKSVEMMREFLKNMTPELKDKIVDNGFRVKNMVERYRKEHFDRLVKGLCTPMAANMYFDMLDFAGNIARHSSNIVKLF